jgi:hypothetical protein
MDIELKFNRQQLPLTLPFIDFLTRWYGGMEFPEQKWPEQLKEYLYDSEADFAANPGENFDRLMADPASRRSIGRVYDWLNTLMVADTRQMAELRCKFRFVSIIGIPRNGGTYVTKEIYRSQGYDPTTVPEAMAHDNFPDASPFELTDGHNSWISSLLTMAQYLTMVELYFGAKATAKHPVLVPKKVTKGVYAGGFFNSVFGQASEKIFTLRHPVPCCISTYEKSGGLPANGKFAVRSTIESWIHRDLVSIGLSGVEIARMNYFDAYLRYWEHYHVLTATTGMATGTSSRVVVYGKLRMQQIAAEYHRRSGSKTTPDAFVVSDQYRTRHPDWLTKSTHAIERVAHYWHGVGLKFNVSDVLECW